MKNYDDLQRFKEKTRTLDIAFKDMSGQTQEAAEQSKWPLIRQLAKVAQPTPFDGSQRIDLPQPQPVRGNEFNASALNISSLPAVAAQPADAAPVASVSSLFPPLQAKPQTVELAVTPPSVVQQTVPAAFTPAPVLAVPRAPVAVPAPAASTEPGRFGSLFRSRNSEPVSLPKETLLKPLLEKIALCR